MIAIDEIETWLTDTSKGLVASARPGQLMMSKLCAQLMNEGGIGFIEAGTGTGKSIAYGLPAMLHGQRVVLSTGKKTLQEQLVMKDLPAIQSKIGRRHFALMKGAANYFCQLRADEFMESGSYDALPEAERLRFQNFVNKSLTGDIGEFQAPWTHAMRVTDCVKMLCPHVDSCKYLAGRNNAIFAPVVVVNHSLLAQDLALGGGKIFGEYDVLVIDEGHNAPRAFRDAFACVLHPQQPGFFERLFHGTAMELDGKLKDAYGRVFRNLQTRSGALDPSTDFMHAIGALNTLVKKTLEQMSNTGLLSEGGDGGENRSQWARQRARFAGAVRLLKKVEKICKVILDEPREGIDAGPYCAAVTVSKQEEPQITVTPIDVGPLVAPALLKARALIVTSATLTTSHSFSYIMDQYGFSSAQVQVQEVVPSPFTYAQQSVLYVSKTAPDPQTRGATYYQQMAPEIHELLTASHGGALVLCASREDMENLHTRLWEVYSGSMNYRLAMQGKEGPERLTAWFKEHPNAVLIAMKTFWEGVDIPGLGLRLVIIPRIPFPNRGDVLLQARKDAYVNRMVEAGEDLEQAKMASWSKYDLNEALLDLAQGGGRLIRTERDMGVVALLDRRALGKTKQYSSRVRRTFPHPECADKSQVLNFLNAIRKAVVP